MRQTRDINTVKLTFYPMAGGVYEQFNNLLETLHWVSSIKHTPDEVCKWLRSRFNLSSSFARDVYTVLLRSSGLVEIHNEKCSLTSDGQTVLATASPVVLLEIFEKAFAGITVFLEVLRAHPYVKTEALNAMWFEIIKMRFPRMQEWSERTLHNQCRHRINWLRAMGFITLTRSVYSLSESGWQFVQEHPPEAIAIQSHEVEEQERQLQEAVSRSFQLFDPSTKTYSLRQSFVRDRAFRKIVVSQYDYHCAICEFRFIAPDKTYEADAAHVVPKSKQGTDDPRNGVCLCKTCHWLFDTGVVSIYAEDLSILTASYLKKKVHDKSVQQVLEYSGKQIHPVKNTKYSPAPEALKWHNQKIFLG